MGERAVHCVGSFPADDADDAMRAMMTAAGSLLRTLPTGETRRHRTYILPIIDDLVAQGALDVRRVRGERTRYRLRRGIEPSGDAMRLGYCAEARDAVPTFTELRESGGPALQIGMASDFTLGFIALGLPGAISNRRAFTDATVAEMVALRDVPADTVIQLEAPAELVLMAEAQPLHRAVDAALGLSRGIGALAARAPEGTRFGVHLCLGSRRNRARATLRDVRPLVDLANAVVRHWPSGRTLEFVHGPLTGTGVAPSGRPEFYAPLADLDLGSGTSFYAGFIDEDSSDEQLVRILHMIESALGRPVDGVSNPCGLGRCSRATAEKLIARAVTVALAD
ncbi:MAG: hypothetical protein J2P18_03505 [Nocardia sp.]|nr:hypothetical protein [Nocardia sp.]